MFSSNITLLVETGLYDEPFYSNLENLCNFYEIKYEPVEFWSRRRFNVEKLYSNNHSSIFPYGCIQFIKQYQSIISHDDFVLGGQSLSFFDLRKMAYSHYGAYWSDLLLNDNWISLPYSQFIAQKEWLYNIFGPDKIFVRPDANDKLFTGTSILKKDFDHVSKHFGYSCMMEIDNHIPVIVSKSVEIQKEWRFAIINKKIASCSLYMQDGDNYEEYGCDNSDVYNFVSDKIITNLWQPEEAYVADIALTENGPKLIEIGSINSAGWYAMNVADILQSLISLVNANNEALHEN